MFQLKKIQLMIAVLLLATSSAFAGGDYIAELGTPLSVGTAGVAKKSSPLYQAQTQVGIFGFESFLIERHVEM